MLQRQRGRGRWLPMTIWRREETMKFRRIFGFATEDGDAEVYKKSSGIRHFSLLLYAEESELVPGWANGPAREGQDE